MRPDDILAFARRDWELLADSKAAYWRSVAALEGVERLFEMADTLRRFAMKSHAEWPSKEDRESDLLSHARVAATLSHAARRWNR